MPLETPQSALKQSVVNALEAELGESALLLDRQICFPLYAASNLLTRLYRPILATLGLTYPQYLVMLVLWECDPMGVGDLGRALHLDSGTLTPLLKRMEGAGFVSRARDENDERRVLISLTSAGQSLKNDARRVPATLVHDLGLDLDQINALRLQLRDLVLVLSHQRTPPDDVPSSSVLSPSAPLKGFEMTSLSEIPLARIDGNADSLGSYAGNVALIVNVASKCGLTPQYEGLEALYQAKKDQGLVILGFPANNFNGQEPGTESEIQSFCTTTFNVQFPMFSKVSVVGEDQHPLYAALTAAAPEPVGEGPFRERLAGFGITPNPLPDVLWNFEKFLVNGKGEVIGRFAPDVAADDPRLIAAIDAALAIA